MKRSCLRGSVCGRPVWASQIRAVLSIEIVTICLPFGLNWAEFTEAAALVSKHGPAREAILRGQDQRVQHFATEATLGKLREVLDQL